LLGRFVTSPSTYAGRVREKPGTPESLRGQIPRISTGKFQKSALRERFRDYYSQVRESV
jgi:acyl-CoA synthetase (AMP-forming)/AMP-acid ligase II